MNNSWGWESFCPALIAKNSFLIYAYPFLIFASNLCFIFITARETSLYGKMVLLSFHLFTSGLILYLSGRILFSLSMASILCLVIFISSIAKLKIFGENLSIRDFLYADMAGAVLFFGLAPAAILWAGAAFVLICTLAVWFFIADRLRARRYFGLLGIALSLPGLLAYSQLYGENKWGVSEEYYGAVSPRTATSHFVRSLVSFSKAYAVGGVLDKDKSADPKLVATSADGCSVEDKPNIILILDESAFMIGDAPGVTAPAGLMDYYESFDGKRHRFGVEAFGSPSYFSETSVLTGLSSRSFGEMRALLPKLTLESMRYSLPFRLNACGYTTSALYPSSGDLVDIRAIYRSLGIMSFRDQMEQGATFRERDAFYYQNVVKLLRDLGSSKPRFVYALTMSNHFPWDRSLSGDEGEPFSAEGNSSQVNEYIHRQLLSQRDFTAFKQELTRAFPGEPFLIVRFGDHQPFLARDLWRPKQSGSAKLRAIARFEAPFFTTYYAVDAINFMPKAALPDVPILDAPYLGPLIAKLAGLPLDGVQAYHMNNVIACQGEFYACRNGEVARKLNGAMANAGLLPGL